MISRESILFQSVRKWVMQQLPISDDDTELSTHLENLSLHDLLVTFHNWSSRLVSGEPRKVHVSPDLAQSSYRNSFEDELKQIRDDIEAGNSLNKYLSRGVKVVAKVHSDQSGLQRRQDLDLLLNDWGIHHLHLSTTVERDGFVSRTGPLLFAIFTSSNAYLLDIMPHGNWTAKHLMEVLVRNFPNSGTFHRLNGVKGLAKEYDERELQALRSSGVSAVLEVDGKVVIPKGMMTTAGTTVQATRDSDRLLEVVEEFEKIIETRPNDLKRYFDAGGCNFPSEPSFVFGTSDKGVPGFLEENSGLFLPLF